MFKGWIFILVCRCGCNFTTLKGGTETALTERHEKSTLNTLRQTLTAHSLTWVTEALKIGWLQKHGHIHYLHQEKSYERNIYEQLQEQV